VPQNQALSGLEPGVDRSLADMCGDELDPVELAQSTL